MSSQESIVQGNGHAQLFNYAHELMYSYRRTRVRTFMKDGATDTTYTVRFDPRFRGSRLSDMYDQLRQMFMEVLHEVTMHLHPDDSIRIVIKHDDLADPIIVPLRPLKDMTVEDILATIENALQSNAELKIDKSFKIQIGTIKEIRGGAKLPINNLRGKENAVMLKKSMVNISNADNMCMARAIVVSWANACRVSTDEWHALTQNLEGSTCDKILHVKKVPGWYYSKLRDSKRAEQGSLARALCQLANVDHEQPASLNDIPAFEAVLGVDIGVISSRMGNRFIRVPLETDEENPRTRVYLYHVHGEGAQVGHFHAITKVSGFFGSSYFCNNCMKPYSNKGQHSCEKVCNVCHHDECVMSESKCTCIHCHMTCRSRECLERHLVKKKRQGQGKGQMLSQCDIWWKCTTCNVLLNRLKRDIQQHICGEWQCVNCEQNVVGEHLCYLRARPAVDHSQFKHIYFDFECRQDDIFQCENGCVKDLNQRCRACRGQELQCLLCQACVNCNKQMCGMPLHKPNLVVAHTVCHHCHELPIEEPCSACGTRCVKCLKWDSKNKCYARQPCRDTCGKREVVFKGDNTATLFGAWLFSKQHKDSTVLAHNMKGYDGYFLLDYLIDQSIYPSKMIYSGSKVMYMHVGRGLNIRVIDSLNFLNMPLAKIPKSFGLSELKKGYFCHFFNTVENANYVGVMPDAEYYGANQFSSAGKEDFEKWYEEQQGNIFDMEKEILEYCRSDVTILREGCTKFRNLMLKITKGLNCLGVDPFQSLTIASVCMIIYRTKFLEEEYSVTLRNLNDNTESSIKGYLQDGTWTYHIDGSILTKEEIMQHWEIVDSKFQRSPIASVPITRGIDNHSQASIAWLEWVSRQKGIKIRHALSPGGEFRVPGTRYKADGYDPISSTIWEYNGCVWHGCPQTFKNNRGMLKHPYTKQSFSELYRETLEKRKKLTSMGYKVVTMWECQFRKNIEDNPALQEFIKGLEIEERLDPRDSFFGGRTNAAKLYHETQRGEKIKYIDFTSLYPFVNKTCRYPVGHPTILTGNNITKSVDQYFGIAKVKVLAPRGLYHPVLPYKSGGKLKFPLCKTCADTESQNQCTCSDEQRVFVGTWCTPELTKAMEVGYKITRVYEVYHWDTTTVYDVTTGKGGLFAGYINMFLKIKQEASGWPSWCKTEEDKYKYIGNYKHHEGIQLDYNKIDKNDGLRSLAKLCLNSFWGKFGQRPNFKQTTMIHDSEAHKFHQMLTDPSKKILDFYIIGEDILSLQWEHVNDLVPQSCVANTNIYIATFTTAWARLKLYDALHLLQKRALYYDTDSVIFISKEGEPEPPLGDYLGDFTDELGAGDFITKYVSGGPKNYAYMTNEGVTACKVRGFTLNHTNSQLVNFDTVLNEVLRVPQNIVTTNPSKICRDAKTLKIYSKREDKKYSMVYTKRVITDDFYTLPYGY